MKVDITQNDGFTCCLPHGEIDAFTVGEFRTQLSTVTGHTAVIIDLTHVPFMDSSGLGALIGLIRRVRDAGGDVAVVCDQSAVLRLLHTTRFDRMVAVTATADEAKVALIG